MSYMPPNMAFYAIVGTDNVIYSSDMQGNKPIGVTLDAYEKAKNNLNVALEKAEKLYNLCVEKGVITPEPTQDEILKNALNQLQESKEQNAKLAEIVTKLSTQLEGLTDQKPVKNSGGK